MTSTYWTDVASPLGPLLLTAAPDGALTSLSVPGQKGGRVVRDDWQQDPGPFRPGRGAARRLLRRGTEGVPADVAHRRLRLPGEGLGRAGRHPVRLDVTYGEIAALIGAPRAAVRAVGGATGANSLLVVRPCHRVIGADGTLTGYAGGLERKVRLLTHEGVL
ncbi:Methylated-DNA--protein-cysteine methyltransferase OS=Streptomyces violarus OX=67380 GN=FHS41_001512 PE=3 SV=1 [Streptomyces violarus]